MPPATRKLKKSTGSRSTTLGKNTLAEILSQPRIWAETQERLRSSGILDQLADVFSPKTPWLFVGCGSSYYLSRLIAALWTKYFQIDATGIPASELLFAPDEILRQSRAEQVVLMSRSGETTEVLRAAELLKSRKTLLTLGVTCNKQSVLEKLCTHTFTLDWADEKSMVMTRSFTAILLSFQALGAKFLNESEPAEALNKLPNQAATWLEEIAPRIQNYARTHAFKDYVFLGQNAHYWLAQEAGLKITEISSSYAQAYHSMEFRHGPRSIAGPDTLITILVSDAAAEEEEKLCAELKSLGAAICVVVNRATPGFRKHSDLLIELALDAPEFARYAVSAIPAHLLGTAVGLRKGLDPDSPKNLTRAVVLDSEHKRPTKRSGA